MPKGRPVNQGGPFENEAILPEPPAPKTKTAARSGTIRRDARRYYSQFEVAGPSLEERDEQDEQDEEDMEIESDCIVLGAGTKRKATTQQRKKGKKRKTTKKTSKLVKDKASRPGRAKTHLYDLRVKEWWDRRAQRRSSWEVSNTDEDVFFDSLDEDDPFPRKEDFIDN
ncbi:hypothetical protein B0T26DRAFT_807906 [Lasiosphaeria miniovina]|uniref:Uncharacterized protein n=1 Tax=Lasiosphaeria miniovina TaxID=1954250 RepID=A0AA39ZR98_9PEZI|nr:uncharacterized protein B0T26DRAFT_807906 [Lasiosphaeria miniovina]KAK0702118.1 hypothetical protein B0T26DRAFT_807906 [Lasiosphaeria miniovina]